MSGGYYDTPEGVRIFVWFDKDGVKHENAAGVLAEPEIVLPTIVRVQRNGDFQTVFFSDGSYVYGGSEQYEPHGDWRDSTGIQNVIRLAGYTGPGAEREQES